ncbi:hypothetical protein EVA_14757 [gut metagenome]|uniref:Uncharacterized protein n=1 Tax=gut metagenome TaxID=749906 RepID=J9G5R5_9ZZZZ
MRCTTFSPSMSKICPIIIRIIAMKQHNTSFRRKSKLHPIQQSISFFSFSQLTGRHQLSQTKPIISTYIIKMIALQVIFSILTQFRLIKVIKKIINTCSTYSKRSFLIRQISTH